MAGASFKFSEGERITSVAHFLEEIKRFAGKGDHRVYFRGQDGPTEGLLPSVGREHYYLGKSLCLDEASERKLLTRFRRHAYGHFGRVPSEWETLFLARHHGLPTRLLDWTSNPLVSLYFAAFYESDEIVPGDGMEGGAERLSLDGTVWALQPRADLEELDVFRERRSPLRIPGIKLVFPFNPTPRMTAQSGVFTLHGDPWVDVTHCAGKVYPIKELDVQKLTKWKIESRYKTEIILDLERMAINSRTLFPDLEGLARGLWQTEIIRRCFETQAGNVGFNKRPRVGD